MLDLNLLQTLKLNIINMEFCHLDHTWHYSNVKSPFTRLYLITGGEGYVQHHNHRFRLAPGTMHLIPGFTLSSYHCDSYLDQYYAHFSNELEGRLEMFAFGNYTWQVEANDFDLTLFQRLLALNPNKALKERDPQKYDRKSHLILAQEPDKSYTPAAFLESKGIMLQLLARFLTPDAATGENRDDRSFVRLRQVLFYIDRHLSGPIQLEKLAGLCHLHPDYFSRLFARIMGVRPVEYINRRRIEKAQLLLLTTPAAIDRIARETGFESTPYFSRVFKQYSGTTPAHYRKAPAPLY